MALAANAIGLDRKALIIHVGDEEMVGRYSQGDEKNVVNKLDAWTAEFRSAAIKGGYSAESVDALTATTCPATVKDWILHAALDALTANMGVADTVREWGERARLWLKRLAGGAETIDGLTKVSAGGTSVDYRAPAERTFDRKNESQKYNLRDPEI